MSRVMCTIHTTNIQQYVGDTHVHIIMRITAIPTDKVLSIMKQLLAKTSEKG